MVDEPGIEHEPKPWALSPIVDGNCEQIQSGYQEL